MQTATENPDFAETGWVEVMLSINREESVISGEDGREYLERISRVRISPNSDLCASRSSSNFACLREMAYPTAMGSLTINLRSSCHNLCKVSSSTTYRFLAPSIAGAPLD